MYNVYAFEYINRQRRDMAFCQRTEDIIESKTDKLEGYVNANPHLNFKRTSRIYESSSIKTLNENTLDQLFNTIRKTASTDKNSIFVIFFSDESAFLRSFFIKKSHYIRSLILFCKKYFTLRKRLSTGLYNRLIIDYGHSYDFDCEDLINNKHSTVFVDNLTRLSVKVLSKGGHLHQLQNIINDPAPHYF